MTVSVSSPLKSLILGLPMLLSVAFLAPGEARACCDVIPSPTDFFRAGIGSITTPALIPGLPVQVFARPAVCSHQILSAAADLREFDNPAGCDNLPGNLCQ